MIWDASILFFRHEYNDLTARFFVKNLYLSSILWYSSDDDFSGGRKEDMNEKTLFKHLDGGHNDRRHDADLRSCEG